MKKRFLNLEFQVEIGKSQKKCISPGVIKVQYPKILLDGQVGRSNYA